MKPKVSLDFLRGALALYALRQFYLSGRGLWLGIAQWHLGHQQVQLSVSLGLLAIWGFILGTAFFPSRPAWKAVFVLLAALFLASLLCQFYWLRNSPPFADSRAFHFHYGIAVIGAAWAALAWVLYRRWPKN